VNLVFRVHQAEILPNLTNRGLLAPELCACSWCF